MGDQYFLDPFVDFEAILDAIGDAPLRVPEVGGEEPTNLRRSAGEGLGTLENAFVTIPDGRTLLAVEHEALMTFARANGIGEKWLWKRISEISQRGRATAANFVWCEVTDLSALASCTKIESLALGGNKIADISALASCGELVTLHLFENRIADISALANCKRLEMLSLSQNRLSDLSPLSRCGELAFLGLDCNGLTDISALADCGTLVELDLSGNQIPDISPLSRCVTLRELKLPYNQITDISALESCAQLCMVELTGNPLSKKSLQVIEKLRDRRVRVYC
jgi:Leucine-rich repeat (LRR) protein